MHISLNIHKTMQTDRADRGLTNNDTETCPIKINDCKTLQNDRRVTNFPVPFRRTTHFDRYLVIILVVPCWTRVDDKVTWDHMVHLRSQSMAIVQHENEPELLFAGQAWWVCLCIRSILSLGRACTGFGCGNLALQVDLRRHFFKDVLETGAMLNEERRDALEAGLDGAWEVLSQGVARSVRKGCAVLLPGTKTSKCNSKNQQEAVFDWRCWICEALLVAQLGANVAFQWPMAWPCMNFGSTRRHCAGKARCDVGSALLHSRQRRCSGSTAEQCRSNFTHCLDGRW